MDFSNFGTKDMGIDIGSSKLRVTFEDKGIVLEEPTLIVVNKKSGQIIATGMKAQNIMEQNPITLKAVHPVQNGQIIDIDYTEIFMRDMIKKIYKEFNTGRPRIFANVPTDINEVQQKALENALYQMGAKEIFLIDAPIAAAVGCGLRADKPIGNMIIDIGAGKTEAAVVSMGEVVVSDTTNVAGNAIDEEIIQYLKDNLSLSINKETAEELKIQLGGAESLIEEKVLEVTGRNVETGLPYTIPVSSKDIEKATKKSMQEITNTILSVISNTPPELVSDIIQNGIYITGGGAHTNTIDNFIAQKTGVKTYIAEEPEHCIARGIDKIINNTGDYSRMMEARRRRKLL